MSRRYEAVIDGREVRCFQDWNDEHWIHRDDLVSDEADQDCATELEDTDET
jgi:hypothetical protein